MLLFRVNQFGGRIEGGICVNFPEGNKKKSTISTETKAIPVFKGEKKEVDVIYPTSTRYNRYFL